MKRYYPSTGAPWWKGREKEQGVGRREDICFCGKTRNMQKVIIGNMKNYYWSKCQNDYGVKADEF